MSEARMTLPLPRCAVCCLLLRVPSGLLFSDDVWQGLSFKSDFLDTRQICKEQKKWFMVNIQASV